MEDNFNKVYSFVQASTINFDENHNHLHAKEVYDLTQQILDIELGKNNYDYNLMMITSLLHDVCDEKYKNKSITKQELHNFIDQIEPNKEKVKLIIKIIDNISYSKEIKLGLDSFTSDEIIYRNALSDADKILALGPKGIHRCFEYTRQNNLELNEEEITKIVIQHCHDKLLKLYSQNFIRTSYGRKLAEPLHRYITNYINS